MGAAQDRGDYILSKTILSTYKSGGRWDVQISIHKAPLPFPLSLPDHIEGAPRPQSLPPR